MFINFGVVAASILLIVVIALILVDSRPQPIPDRTDLTTLDDVALQQVKTRYEIEDLREGPRRARTAAVLSMISAVLSVVTTILVAGGGWFLSVQLDQRSRGDRIADTYQRLMDRLGSRNDATRVDAVLELKPYLMGAYGDEDRSQQTIRILLSKLKNDNNPEVLASVIEDVEGAGQSAIPSVRKENSESTYALSAQIAQYGRQHTRFICPGRRADASANQLNNKNEDAVVGAMYDALAPFGANPGEEVGTWVSLHYPGDIDCSTSVPRRKRPPSANAGGRETRLPPAPIPSQALMRDVVATSRILATILPGAHPATMTQDWSTVSLIGMHWAGSDLTGIDLRGSYVDGDAQGARFDGAHLEGATLLFLGLRDASLRGAHLAGTVLSANGLAYSKPHLDGADWWNAYIADFPGQHGGYGNRIQPDSCVALTVWLRSAYPHAPYDKTSKCRSYPAPTGASGIVVPPIGPPSLVLPGRLQTAGPRPEP